MLSFILECVDIFTPYFVQEVAYLFGEFYYNTNPTIYYILYIMSY